MTKDPMTPKPSTTARMRKVAMLVLPPLFVVAALLLLHHELRAYHLRDILRETAAIPWTRIGIAAGLTLAAYLVLAGYDWLGFRYIRHPLGMHKIASAAFISYALSYNLGHTLITGGSVRYRLYSAWGLSTQEVIKVVVFCILTFWVGVCAIAGVAFFREPATIALALHLPGFIVKPIGWALVALVAAYLALTAVRRRPIRFRSWEFVLPRLSISVAQIIVTCLDLVLAGTVLFVLMPSDLGVSFPALIGIYLVAVVIGLVSQVPGGLGVFETAFFHLLPSSASSPAVVGALLAYRGVYYLFPLTLALLMLAGHEVRLRLKKAPELKAAIGRWLPTVIPQALAFATFVGGALLLFSGATPAADSRLHWLAKIASLPVLEISHFMGSLAGVALILLAHGIQRRLDAAYWMSVLLLAGGAIFSLLKGLDYEEAVVLVVMLLVLLPCRPHFYRKAAFFSEPFTVGWLAAIGIVLACSISLGLFSYKHVEYSHDQWWHFAIAAEAPRFLRATVGVAAFILIVAIGKLLRHAAPRLTSPTQADVDKARPIVAASPDTVANLALLCDKALLFNDKNSAFIMYAVEGRSWISMGGPIGSEGEHADLVWRFRELVDRHDGWTVFYQVQPESIYLYLDLGLTLLKLGEEARVPLAAFSLDGSARKGLRHTKTKAEREGCSFEVIPAARTPGVLVELKVISDTWLAEKSTREKGFSLGFFSDEYIARCPVAVVRDQGRIAAFANLWLGAGKEELSVDLMRYLPDAPPGSMDFLFINLLVWGHNEGYRYFNLGMAPLAGFDNHPLASLWNRVGGFIFRHGEHFYNFEGLRQYKSKFDPEWTPKYLAAPGGFALPRVLANLTTLIAGGLKGAVGK